MRMAECGMVRQRVLNAEGGMVGQRTDDRR
jgi:hypothetical protein